MHERGVETLKDRYAVLTVMLSTGQRFANNMDPLDGFKVHIFCIDITAVYLGIL